MDGCLCRAISTNWTTDERLKTPQGVTMEPCYVPVLAGPEGPPPDLRTQLEQAKAQILHLEAEHIRLIQNNNTNNTAK
jgi:hypothetical protein